MKDLLKRVNRFRLLVVVLALMLLGGQLGAQTSAVTIKGIVKDAAGTAVIGASVVEKGTTNGTITGAEGRFTLKVKAVGVPLEVSFVGFKTQEVKASSGEMKITLQEDTQLVEEVVVMGYGTQRKRDVTGAITSISSESIERKVPTSVYDALQGSVAGVQVMAGSGQPGEGASVKIRGTSTFSAAGVKPLYVVDGVPMEDIDAINPNDIASVEILKDAASGAIYGSRSANGVVIITTKAGEVGKPRVDVKYNHSWGELSHKMPQSNRLERRQYDQIRRTYMLANKVGNPAEAMEVIQDSLNMMFNVDNDYQDLLFNTARRDQVDLSVSGGDKKIKYYGTTGYFNERGIVPNTSYSRLTARVNADYNATRWLNIGSRFSLTYSKKQGLNEGQLMSAVLSRRPYFSTYYPDGTMVGVFQGQKNPVAQAEYTTDQTSSYRGVFYQFFEISILKDLKFRTNINANFYLDRRNRMYPSIITDEWQKSNEGYQSNALNWNWLNEDYLTYAKKWGSHNFSAMLGFSAQQWRTETDIMAGLGSSTDYIYTMNGFVSNLDLSQTTGTISNHSLASVFARITYDYKGRYLLNINVRRDGSSRFAKNNKWGNFPSVSAGWRFSDEPFMKFSKSFLDDAKIRVSYGITGNEQIGNYDYVYSYGTGTIYDGIGGLTPARIGLDNLKWEETRQANYGIDLAFWNGRLTLTADYYDKYTKDLLANRELPKESGYSTMRTNLSEMSNRGFEIAVAGDLIRTRNVRWNAGFNISRNVNRIEKLAGSTAYMEGDSWWMQEGLSVGTFYGYRSNGVFQYDQSNAFTEDWRQLTPVFANGQFQNMYLLDGVQYTGTVKQKTLPSGKPFRGGDYNWMEAPGQENGIIDDNDRQVLGNALPDVTGGLNTTVSYKGLSLYVSLYYSLGGEIYNSAEATRNAFKYSSYTPAPSVIGSIWQKQGDVAAYPRPYNDEYDNARTANSFYIEDASYIRLQNIRLSWELPQRWLKGFNVKSVNLYGFINNALTWTNYSGYDPEFSTSNPLQIGKDTYRYPMKREYGLGLSVNF